MYRTDAGMRCACTARRSEVLTVIADHRFLAPATLAGRDRLATTLARHALLRDGGTTAAASGMIRRWLGALQDARA